ncbi:type II toxin-antitoxin system RelE/ParE family toxin [Nostocoides sp. F2B08]|uniref:type II toxin-antitoxin system RelE family toxin n=1 Tax=Nostocoides sp. F2B08 TaxID=2653936 RepID=UPI001262FB87|nr:type II toxin-antitoxin system RelE/ParE family toxin [Tetrasphaera sp. F2B08]KAB7743316.1 type II toxin-antitoxin system RelE/ParE family toxin [Tetrasphaera sp. F2B08]
MTWEVVLASAAQRDLALLPHRVVPGILEFCARLLAQNPHRVGRPSGGELDGLHSARRGDYRILYRIVEADGSVLVVRIAHRATAYRSRG